MSIKILGTIDKVTAKDGRVIQQAGDTDGVVASFYDLSGRPSLFLDGTQARLGNVGVKTATPNQALTVVGNVSSDGYHYGLGVIGAGGGDLELKAGEFPWTLRWASGNLEVATSKGLIGGSYGGSQVMFPNGGGLQLNSLRDGGTYVQTGSAGDAQKTWAFTNDGSLTLPAGATLQSAGPDIRIGSNLVPTTSAFYIGDPGNPVAGIYLAATTLYIASTFAGVSGLKLSNIDNVFTVADGGLRSSVIYTGGLLLSGNNIAADPLYSNLPMTVGGGLASVDIKVNTTVAGTLSSSGLISQQKNHCVAALTTNQAMSGGDVQIRFTDKDDPNGWWDSANHQFKPTVAGYYNVIVMVNWRGTNAEVQVNNQLRKNGNTIALSQMPIPKTLTHSLLIQAITFMNGSSDYIDCSGYAGANTDITGEANGVWTKFEAFKIS